MLKLNLISFIVGLVMGVIFSLLKLPIPAPNNLAGVLGILGVFVGFMLVKQFIKS